MPHCGPPRELLIFGPELLTEVREVVRCVRGGPDAPHDGLLLRLTAELAFTEYLNGAARVPTTRADAWDADLACGATKLELQATATTQVPTATTTRSVVATRASEAVDFAVFLAVVWMYDDVRKEPAGGRLFYLGALPPSAIAAHGRRVRTEAAAGEGPPRWRVSTEACLGLDTLCGSLWRGVHRAKTAARAGDDAPKAQHSAVFLAPPPLPHVSTIVVSPASRAGSARGSPSHTTSDSECISATWADASDSDDWDASSSDSGSASEGGAPASLSVRCTVPRRRWGRARRLTLSCTLSPSRPDDFF